MKNENKYYKGKIIINNGKLYIYVSLLRWDPVVGLRPRRLYENLLTLELLKVPSLRLFLFILLFPRN